MRILLATPLYPPEIGGPATYAQLMADELPRRGFSVDVLPFRDVRKYPKVIRHILYFFKVFVRAQKADVVFAQDPVSVGLPALCASKMVRKPFFIRVAGDYAWEQAVQRYGVSDSIDEFQKKHYGFRTEFLRKIESFVVQGATRVITPSKYFRELVAGWVRHSKDKEKIIAIYNGITLPQECKQPPEPRTIISAGRLVPWKGFDTLIQLIAEMPGWKLRVVGDGPDHERLTGIAHESGVEDRVEMLGSIPRDDLLKELCRSSVFVLNSSFESFSFQLVEAMAVGRPVVAARIGNLSEIITDKETGMLVTHNDEKELREAILKLEEDKELRAHICINAKKRAHDFSLDKTLDTLAEELKKNTKP